MGILPGLQAVLMGIDKLEEVIRLQSLSFLIAGSNTSHKSFEEGAVYLTSLYPTLSWYIVVWTIFLINKLSLSQLLP